MPAMTACFWIFVTVFHLKWLSRVHAVFPIEGRLWHIVWMKDCFPDSNGSCLFFGKPGLFKPLLIMIIDGPLGSRAPDNLGHRIRQLVKTFAAFAQLNFARCRTGWTQAN